jgi:hypothetical protein
MKTYYLVNSDNFENAVMTATALKHLRLTMSTGDYSTHTAIKIDSPTADQIAVAVRWSPEFEDFIHPDFDPLTDALDGLRVETFSFYSRNGEEESDTFYTTCDVTGRDCMCAACECRTVDGEIEQMDISTALIHGRLGKLAGAF